MFDDNKPKLKLEKDQTQRFIELATFGVLIIAFIYALINYGNLPVQVPMHFNISGKVDNYGDKSLVWFPIIIGFVLCFGLYKLNKHPHLFNYPNKITEDNAKEHYTSAVKMMSLVNLFVAILMALVSYQIVSLGLSGSDKTSTWTEYLIYAIIGIMTIAPIVLVIKNAFNTKETKS